MQKKENKKTSSTRYVTVYEATQESGMSERSIRRWIAQEKVDAMQDKNRHVRVALEEVLALAKSSGEQSPLHLQVRELRHTVARLEECLGQAVERIEQLEQGAESRGQQESTEKRVLAGAMDAVAKRGLPEGTIRLVDFAQVHHLSPHQLKTWYYEHSIRLTVYERPGGAKRNKQEWWVSPEQCQQALAYAQEQGLAYQQCPECPHGGHSAETSISEEPR